MKTNIIEWIVLFVFDNALSNKVQENIAWDIYFIYLFAKVLTFYIVVSISSKDHITLSIRSMVTNKLEKKGILSIIWSIMYYYLWYYLSLCALGFG